LATPRKNEAEGQDIEHQPEQKTEEDPAVGDVVTAEGNAKEVSDMDKPRNGNAHSKISDTCEEG